MNTLSMITRLVSSRARIQAPLLASKDQCSFHYNRLFVLWLPEPVSFPLLKFTLRTLVLYPKNVPTKALPVTVARLADGRVWAISVLLLPTPQITSGLYHGLLNCPNNHCTDFIKIAQHMQSKAKLYGNS